jgi:hypothetical protein
LFLVIWAVCSDYPASEGERFYPETKRLIFLIFIIFFLQRPGDGGAADAVAGEESFEAFRRRSSGVKTAKSA